MYSRLSAVTGSCLWALLLGVGCAGVLGLPRSVRDEAPYAAQLGTRYRLTVDCYIVRHADGSRVPVIYPGTVAYYRFPLPVDPKHVGWASADGTIIGTAPRGTTIRVADIVRKRSIEYDVVMYYVALDRSAQDVPEILNAYPLFTRGDDVPVILEDVGVRVWDARDARGRSL